MRVVLAGAAYFAAVFAVGFGLGALRLLVLAPRIGDTPAVLAELPVILATSWWICAALATALSVPAAAAPRLAMGGVAFGLLMTAETTLSIGVFGRSWSEHLAAYGAAAGMIGLAGQVAFGLFPLLQLRRARKGG